MLCLSFHPSPDLHHVIASCSKDKTVLVWDWKEGEKLKTLEVGKFTNNNIFQVKKLISLI